MNARTVAAEIAALTALFLWVYAGAALLVAAAGDGASLSPPSVHVLVILAYLLSRVLAGRDMSGRAMRFWGVGLSIIVLYAILRFEIAGDAYVWRLGWLADLLADPNQTLEGQGAAITTVVLLGAAWVWCVIRGTTSLTIDRVMTEAGIGLAVMLIAATFVDAADAPEMLRWLPVPFMVASLLALALLHARPADREGQRAFLSPWLVWTAGAIGAIALLSLIAALIPSPSLAETGDALVAAARGIGIALAWTFSPLFFAIGWTFDHIPWPFHGSKLPDQPEQQPQQRPKEAEPSQWSIVLGSIVRSGIVVIAAALVLAVLWLAFRRFTRKRDGAGDETREDVSPEAAGILDGLRSLLPRLPRRSGGVRSRDTIGRLYVSVLRAASQRGLERPPAATPLEFAPLLEDRFASPVPSTISRAYAEARYASRPPDPADVEHLRAQWQTVVRRQ